MVRNDYKIIKYNLDDVDILKEKYCIAIFNNFSPIDKLTIEDVKNIYYVSQLKSEKHDGIIGEYKSYLIDVLSVHNSFYNLGKNIYDLNFYSNISDIELKMPSEKIINMLKEWINLNDFPSKRFDNKNYYYYLIDDNNICNFIKHSIIVYTFTSIKIIIDKIINEKPKNTIDDDLLREDLLGELNNYVSFINPCVLLSQMKKDNEFINQSYPYDKLIETLNKHNNKYNQSYLNALLKSLILITDYLCKKCNYDYDVSTLRPIYILDELDDFIGVEESKSIMGISMLRLQQIITSEERGFLTRCSNPNCKCLISSSNGAKYCKKNECQKYRNNLKSKVNYHKKISESK